MKKRYIGTAAFLFSFLFCASLHAQEDAVNIHGFISQGYIKTTRNSIIADSEDGTFQYNEMGINFGHQPLEKLYISLQFFARDLGSVGNDEIQLDYALADYRVKDWLGIRAGRMKNPMGIYSEYRDVDMLRTCIVLPISVYDENLRDSQTYANGIGIYGDINTDRFGSFSYQALIGGNNIASDSAAGVSLGRDIFEVASVEMDTIYSYSLQYSDPAGYLKLGGTAFFTDLSLKGESLDLLVLYGAPLGSPVNLGVNNIEIYTSGAELTYKNFKLTYEFKYTKARNYTMMLEAAPAGSPPVANIHIDQIGRYIMLDYQFNEMITAGVYHEVYYPYRRDKSGNNPGPGTLSIEHFMKKWAFSSKINFNANWLLKLEAHYMDGVGGVLPIHNEDGFKKHWWLFAGKVSYNF